MKPQANNEQTKTVELTCGPGGYGFTLSGQSPCVLSCVLPGSPAHKVDLKPGDRIIAVNGSFVKELPHEQVVKLITQSPKGVVQLTVQKPLDSTGKDYPKPQTPCDEDDINKNILNRVDKVVEELKSGQLFVKSNALPFSFPNGHFICEGDIASDEELKASFTESIKGDNSPYSTLSRQTLSDTECENSNVTMFDTQQAGNRSFQRMASVKSTSTEEEKDQVRPILRAVVGYLGSIKLPDNSNLETASLNEIRSCVRRLRAQQKVHVFFLMEVLNTGVKLISAEGKTIVTYPAKSLAFTGVCSDDQRVFGIVTRKYMERSENKSSGFPGERFDTETTSTNNCSCHVFCVDPEIKRHELHIGIAEKFGFSCDSDVDGFGCKEFPSSSSSVLESINSLSENASERTESCSSERESSCRLARQRSLSSSSASSVTSQSEFGSGIQLSGSKTHLKGKVKMCHVSVTAMPIDSNVKANNNSMVEFKAHRQIKYDDISRLSQSKEKKNDHIANKVSVKPPRQLPQLGGKYNYYERNDSGLGSDSLNLSNEVIAPNCYYNGSSMITPRVNVSTFHSRDSSIDSQMSLESHHSSITDQGSMSSDGIVRNLGQPGAVRYPMADQSSRFYVSYNHEAPSLSIQKQRHESATDFNYNSSSQSLNSVGSLPSGSENDQRVPRWAVGLDKLMDDPTGVKCFQEFLKKEYSDENITFYLACEKFRAITNQEELKIAAREIFDTHLSATATVPVNIDSLAVRDAEEHLSNPTVDMFTLQQQQVYTLMKFDSYPRFLKSDLYRQCLVAELENSTLPFEEPEEDEKEMKRPGLLKKRSSKSKGNKNVRGKLLSISDDSKPSVEKKKSLLPWKSKQAKKAPQRGGFDSQPSSTRSSCSSLSDSQNAHHSLESLNAERRESDSFQFCRVVLPDRSSTILSLKPGQMLRHALMQLCDRRHFSFASVDVYINNFDKVASNVELEKDMSLMVGSEVILEHRILFRMELPNGTILGIKSRPDQNVRSCVEPILGRHGFPYDEVVIRLVECEVPLDSGIPVASLEHQHVVVETKKAFQGRSQSVTSNQTPTTRNPFTRGVRASNRKLAFDDSVFDDIMRGRRQSMAGGFFDSEGVWISGLKTSRSDESLAELNRGNLSSASFGKSLLKTAGLFGRKKREMNDNGKPFLGKSSRIDNFKSNDMKEFFELISRTQRHRMDDQRGELRGNLELPDFLKIPSCKSDVSGGEVISSSNTRPVVRKTMSSPASTQQSGSFMYELTSQINKNSRPLIESSECKKSVGSDHDESIFDSRPRVRMNSSSSSRKSGVVNSTDDIHHSWEKNGSSNLCVGTQGVRHYKSSSENDSSFSTRASSPRDSSGAGQIYDSVFQEQDDSGMDARKHLTSSSRSDTNLYLSSQPYKKSCIVEEDKNEVFRRRANTDSYQDLRRTRELHPGHNQISRVITKEHSIHMPETFDNSCELRTHGQETSVKDQLSWDCSYSNLSPSQPVTVNTIRGINANYASNFRGRANTDSAHTLGSNTASNKPHGMQKHVNRTEPAALKAFKMSELDSKKLPRSSAVIYDVHTTGRIPRRGSPGFGGIRQARSTGKIRDIGVEPSFTKAVISAYDLSQPSLQSAVVNSSSKAPTPPPRDPETTLTKHQTRSRPRPISEPYSVIAALEGKNTIDGELQLESCDSDSPVIDHTLSPLPPAPSPPETLHHLEMANFPPPTPILKETENMENKLRRSASTDPTPMTEVSPDGSPNVTLTPSVYERTLVADADNLTPKSASLQALQLGENLHFPRGTGQDEEGLEMDSYKTYEDEDLRITFV